MIFLCRKGTRYILLLLLIGVLCAQSCTLHRTYKQPKVDIPPGWRFESVNAKTVANYRWWKQFNDPILDCLILQALNYNYDIKIAVCRVLEYYAQLGIANSALYPTINASGSLSRQQLPTALIPLIQGQSRISNSFNTFLNTSWEIDFWGHVRSATEAARADFLGQVYAQQEVVLTIVSQVAANYILLRQYDRELQISKETLKSRLESVRLSKIRYDVGQVSLMQVRQAESEVGDAEAQVVQFELTIAQQEDLLSILIGSNPHSIIRGNTLDALLVAPAVPAGLPSDLLCQRPDIKSAEQKIVATNARIGEARALFFPQITLTGLYGFASTQLNTLYSNPAQAWNFGLNILQPIFNANNIASQVDQAKARKCEALYEYFNTILTAFKEVDDALIDNQKSQELKDVQKYRVDVLTDYLRLATLQYDNGETDYLTVLDAERNLFRAQLDYAVAQGDTLLSIVNLYKSLGGGWVIDADYCLRQAFVRKSP